MFILPYPPSIQYLHVFATPKDICTTIPFGGVWEDGRLASQRIVLLLGNSGVCPVTRIWCCDVFYFFNDQSNSKRGHLSSPKGKSLLFGLAVIQYIKPLSLNLVIKLVWLCLHATGCNPHYLKTLNQISICLLQPVYTPFNLLILWEKLTIYKVKGSWSRLDATF